MTREHFAYPGDEFVLLAGELRRTALPPFLVGGDRGRSLRALNQVLDLHLAARLLITALDDDAGRVAAVGIFELVAHVLGVAEIELGANAALSQLRHHFLIVGNAVAIEYGHDNRPNRRLCVELAQHGQRGLQPRYADGKTGRRHRLATEARDEAVIATSAADRTEHHRLPLLVRDLGKQLCLEHGAGVVFKTTHHGRIARELVEIAGRIDKARDFDQFVETIDCKLGVGKSFAQHVGDPPRDIIFSVLAIGIPGKPMLYVLVSGERQQWRRRQSARIDEGLDLLDLGLAKAGPLGEIAALVLAAGTEQLTYATLTETIELVDRAQHRQPTAENLVAAKPDRLHHAVEDLAVVALDRVVAARNAQRFHCIRGHHAHLGIRGRRAGADRVGIELHELAKAAGARLLIAEL